MLWGIGKYCHSHFSARPISKLSLRPLLWAMFNLILTCTRQFVLGFGVNVHSPYFDIIDRLSKVSALCLGLSINFEKLLLNTFIVFQHSYHLDELSLAKEDYRKLEKKVYKQYKCE